MVRHKGEKTKFRVTNVYGSHNWYMLYPALEFIRESRILTEIRLKAGNSDPSTSTGRLYVVWPLASISQHSSSEDGFSLRYFAIFRCGIAVFGNFFERYCGIGSPPKYPSSILYPFFPKLRFILFPRVVSNFFIDTSLLLACDRVYTCRSFTQLWVSGRAFWLHV